MNQPITLESLKQRLNKNSKDIEAAMILGNYYFDQDEPAQAIVYYRHALDLNPDLPGVRTDMGTMYWRNENVSLAEQAFREVIAKYDDFGNAYINLGLLLQGEKGDIVSARAMWQRLVNNYPNHDAAGKARDLLQETAHMARL